MRLRACLGLVLLCTGACAHIPEVFRIDVDGSVLELKKKPAPEDAQENGVVADAPPSDAPER